VRVAGRQGIGKKHGGQGLVMVKEELLTIRVCTDKRYVPKGRVVGVFFVLVLRFQIAVDAVKEKRPAKAAPP
jgi:hypothetical protein